MTLDAREDLAEPAVEEVDVRAADPDDLGTQHDLALRGLPGPRQLDELHHALALCHRRPHARDHISPLDACWMHPHQPVTDRRVSDSEGIQRLRPSNETSPPQTRLIF